MTPSKVLRRVTIAVVVVGMASCALPQITTDPSLDADGSDSSGAGSDNDTKAGNGPVGGKSNGTSGSSSNDGGADDAGGNGNVSGSGGTANGGTPSGGDDSGGKSGAGGSANGGRAGNGGSGGSGGTPCNETLCDGDCVDLATDEAHCGGCDKPCAVDQTCTSSSCTGPCGATYDVSAKGFVTSPRSGACWHGVAEVVKIVTGTTATPANFSSCGADCKLCISGSIAKDIDYSGLAGIRIPFNQASTGGAMATVVPKGGDFQVSITNNGTAPLRVQIYGENGDTSPTARWCYNFSGSGTHNIPWGELKTECWINTGIPYNLEPLTYVMVYAYGDDTTAVPYNFCVNSIKDL